ncbi:MAG: hypothetical protein JWN70_6494 [Planctomycetaceae bacterium]|nr:hypothetical protein [Planctomycetaceae bacterium]
MKTKPCGRRAKLRLFEPKSISLVSPPEFHLVLYEKRNRAAISLKQVRELCHLAMALIPKERGCAVRTEHSKGRYMDQDLKNKISGAISSRDLEQVRLLFTDHPAAINPPPPAPAWVEVAVNAMTATGGTPVLSPMLRLLIDLGCDINASKTTFSPLSKMAHAGSVEIVRFFLEHGADPNMDKPVIWAIQNEHGNSLELVKLLELHGADLHRCFPVWEGRQINALFTAEIHKKHDVVEYLRSLGAQLPQQPSKLERKAPANRARSRHRGAAISMPVALMHPFDKIYCLLIEMIPELIGSFQYPEPLCIARAYYYDTHAPCTYLDVRCVSVTQRQQVLEKKQNQPDGARFYLWSPGEECGTRLGVPIPEDPETRSMPQALKDFIRWNTPDAQIKRLFATVHKLLDVDSHLYMQEFRKTLQLVTMKLNELDWSEVCEVSDDFVIAPADGSRFFARDADDLEGGIPAARLGLLQSRGFLGPSERLLGR